MFFNHNNFLKNKNTLFFIHFQIKNTHFKTSNAPTRQKYPSIKSQIYEIALQNNTILVYTLSIGEIKQRICLVLHVNRRIRMQVIKEGDSILWF